MEKWTENNMYRVYILNLIFRNKRHFGQGKYQGFCSEYILFQVLVYTDYIIIYKFWPIFTKILICSIIGRQKAKDCQSNGKIVILSIIISSSGSYYPLKGLIEVFLDLQIEGFKIGRKEILRVGGQKIIKKDRFCINFRQIFSIKCIKL